MLSAPVARAEPALAGVNYVGAPGCPPVEVFTQQVAARTPVFREHAPEHSVRIELVSEPDGVLGRVSLVLSGHAAERELRAARCEEVVEALALVVAILIDPNADTRPLSAGALPPPTTEAVATPPPPPRPSVPAPERRLPLPPARPAAPPSPRGPAVRFIAGAHAAAEGAVTPELMLGPRAFFGVEFERGSAWPTALRLSGARLFSRTLRDDQEGSVALALDVLRADACFVRLQQGRLALEPCVGFDAGVLRADAAHPLGDRDSTLLWAAVGGMVRSSVTFADRFVAEAEIGADIPLVQYRFSFQGRPDLFQTARVGMHLGLGLGVRFP